MDSSPKEKVTPAGGQYDANYGNFRNALYEEIRREAFGEDIGQNSWLTAAEHRQFVKWLELGPGKVLLDVACGAGGPALRIAEMTGCRVCGVDVHEQAIAAARLLAAQRGLGQRADFRTADANGPLEFPDNSFDAITCIDAINHFSGRSQLLSEWKRLLKPGGRLLFTDPTTVTGGLTNAEIAVRSSSSFYLYAPAGHNERLLGECGLQLVRREDASANMAQVAAARHAAREKRSVALREIEGEQYAGQQAFLAMAARLTREGRLSRFVYVAKKPQ